MSIQAQILNLLYDLQKQFNLTYIFIAHGLPTVKHVSSKVAVMYLGKVMELADKDELFERPMHPYTQGLFEAVPIPDPTLRPEEGRREFLQGDIPNAMNPPSGCYFHPRCPYATEECRKTAPQFRPCAPGSTHYAACHHPLENGQGIVRG